MRREFQTCHYCDPRAIGLKVSDELTVPLCCGHHRHLHLAGNEVLWWKNLEIEPLEIAKGLWAQTHQNPATVGTQKPIEDTANTPIEK